MRARTTRARRATAQWTAATLRPPVLGLLALAVSGGLHAQNLSRSGWGEVGLLQTPTARFAGEGELAFTASHTTPYDRYTVAMQPFEWMEGAFRYVNISGSRYGPPGLSGDQNVKDKSIDMKLRLWQESRWMPQVAMGVRDIGGTGLFSSEYVVASKRFGSVDASLGFATGYMGNRGDFGNPLGVINDRFETRPRVTGAGQFNGGSMFRGRVGMFGGIAWQTPWDRLQVKLEYDGNDYRNEPRGIRELERTSPVNVGAVFTVNPNIQFSMGWERGTEAMFALTLRTNLAQRRPVAKTLDPDPMPVRDRDAVVSADGGSGAVPGPGAGTTGFVSRGGYRDVAEQARAERGDRMQALAGVDWDAVAGQLRDQAGLAVEHIAVRGQEVVVRGQQARYFYSAQGLGRSARVLDNALPDGFDWFTVEHTNAGMPIAEASVRRDAFVDYANHRVDLDHLKRGTEIAAPGAQSRDVLYEAPLQRYQGGFGLGYGQVLGGPDGFVMYQINANYSASLRFNRSLWLSGTASYNLLDNYDNFRYDAPSRLPRVRTDMRRYLVTSDLVMPNLQLTGTRRLSRDVYGMAYAGMLESMFGGVGGELLYRPVGERWALGVDANWVRQRGFEQDFRFRDYDVATGHVSLYYELDMQPRVLATLSAGRYLAGDWGATLAVTRIFDNGATMGAWVTQTNVSSAQFGEGSFDNGVFFSIPFDLMLPRATRSRATLTWQPLTRDGGARLARRYSLYGMTGERDTTFFYDNFQRIGD